jgi:hypothetical protein
LKIFIILYFIIHDLKISIIITIIILFLPAFQFYFSDGAGRTGTYIAISNLLERVKVEQAIDVFQSIKMIRAARPQFVENAVSTKNMTFQ